jgi:hypothetical protein
LQGEIDFSCVVTLNHAMSEAIARDVPIDLDLSGVTFVDSRFTAAVGGWERELDPGRFRLEMPHDARLQSLLALRTGVPRSFKPPSGVDKAVYASRRRRAACISVVTLSAPAPDLAALNRPAAR